MQGAWSHEVGEGPLHSVTKVTLGWGRGDGDEEGHLVFERLGERAEIAFQNWAGHVVILVCPPPPTSLFFWLKTPSFHQDPAFPCTPSTCWGPSSVPTPGVPCDQAWPAISLHHHCDWLA